MALMLKRHERDLLRALIGRKCGFGLLYKATRDGCDAEEFHGLCDNRGPTITVLYNTDNSVFGGYVSQSWNQSGGYTNDSNAFLFRLKRNGAFDPKRMPISNSSYALYCESSYGPTFGYNHDLSTFTGTIQKSGKFFLLNGSCDYGNSYDMQGEDENSINNGHLNVKDIEVYQVQDGASDVGDLLETPWRSEVDWNKKTLEKLKSEIQSYKPAENLSIPEVNILLLGQVAAGKSSLFNTINSVFRGEVSARARSGTAENSLTTKFNPFAPISPNMFGFVKKPDKKNKVHAVALVIDASTFDVIPEAIITKIKDLQTVFNTRDLPQVIILTKIDKVCPEVNDNITCVFRSEAILDVLSNVADCFGLPRGHVYPVKNYESETDVDDNISILVLKALKQLLNFTDEYLEDQCEFLTTGRDEAQKQE